MGDIIQFGPNFRTYISIKSKTWGESIQGPMSRIAIGTLVADILKSDEDVEITIEKVFNREI